MDEERTTLTLYAPGPSSEGGRPAPGPFPDASATDRGNGASAAFTRGSSCEGRVTSPGGGRPVRCRNPEQGRETGGDSAAEAAISVHSVVEAHQLPEWTSTEAAWRSADERPIRQKSAAAFWERHQPVHRTDVLPGGNQVESAPVGRPVATRFSLLLLLGLANRARVVHESSLVDPVLLSERA